ncbi:biosynthetic-type acetolactate synthase large subunit [Geosporobacter ferrireducens]|uniref:Acetolactate synthase n=1 Tax=Geosporobacter ferrireducens TaxID=1424294 RepID=A0A1D8GIZ7_9FIRM|nr:biosynthetic-type acetolactate synthase large subunit [Geosporobacter ferrireducens]AOT70878.1 acetolactate synthase, large subunit, biosynthetic type [Geosporobacter ferrireducens]MTI53583.1 biosynthetic-type acetolactate synthase large subunit [Geosporobacter ferrireducens]
MKITGAQAVVECLKENKVEVVFGYPGGAILPVYDSLIASGIHHVLVRNEQGAAHNASGYARVTGKVGVCIATSGPGATNLITGIATAYMDSIPIVAITGQVSLQMIGRDVFQEVDITGAIEPFCKHSYLVKDAEEIPRIMAEAFYIARSGRPGPVLIDIPKDVAQQQMHYKYPSKVELRGYKPTIAGHPLQIKKVVQAIGDCTKPMICVGGGVISANACEEVLTLAEMIQAPVVNTLMGKGAFPEKHFLYAGMVGQHGSAAANKAVSQSDLLIILGARLGDRATGNVEHFAARAKIIHIDVDPAEIGKNVSTKIPIVGDIKHTLGQLIKHQPTRMENDWANQVAQWKKNLAYPYTEEPSLNPRDILRKLSGMVDPQKTILVTDVGQHQMWAGSHYRVERPRSFISSGGLGTMGYGLPAAIGAKIGDREKEIILLTGDGSFQMSVQELAVLMQEDIPVKIVLFNNNALGMVRELQQHYCESRYYQVYLKGNPDFGKLVNAYGIPSIKVEHPEGVADGLRQLLESKTSILIELAIDVHDNVIPCSK